MNALGLDVRLEHLVPARQDCVADRRLAFAFTACGRTRAALGRASCYRTELSADRLRRNILLTALGGVDGRRRSSEPGRRPAAVLWTARWRARSDTDRVPARKRPRDPNGRIVLLRVVMFIFSLPRYGSVTTKRHLSREQPRRPSAGKGGFFSVAI